MMRREDGAEGAAQAELVLGVCAMRKKSQSESMRALLEQACYAFAALAANAATAHGRLRVEVFAEDAILRDPPERWPMCDALLAFYSSGFPLEKAIAYAELRRPHLLCDLHMQRDLLDRRKVYALLDRLDIPTQPRLLVERGNAKDCAALGHITDRAAAVATEEASATVESCKAFSAGDDFVSFGGRTLVKPFVEKPVDAEDHDVYVYYARENGYGARRLFRKTKNRCSELIPGARAVRTDRSYIYEAFAPGSPPEDIKVYAVVGVGRDMYLYAESRRAPTAASVVQRTPDGRELRCAVTLTADEMQFSHTLARACGQFICGFDLIRTATGRSVVVDVNGWAFVKRNPQFDAHSGRLLAARLLSLCQARYDAAQNVSATVVHGDQHSL